MKRVAFILLLFCFVAPVFGQQYYLLVGTYDSPMSDGIYVYRFDSKDGSVKTVSHIPASNPSFLAISPNEKYVYAVNENADTVHGMITGQVSSFSFNKKTGALQFISKQNTKGSYPCYVTTDKTGQWLLTGNYGGGNFSLFAISPAGRLDTAKYTIQHQGSGPDTSRQSSPHVHGIFLKKNNTVVYVTDLGTDRIMRYQFNPSKGTLRPLAVPSGNASPGSGPRHLAFSANEKYVYLLEELAGMVEVFKDSAGQMISLESYSTLPITYKGLAGSADIHLSPDGRFLYCSNRANSNSIAIFSVNPVTGLLKLVGHQETLGQTPRNFNFDPTGRFLVVANQESNELVIFKRDTKTGLLTDTGKRISVGKPVCVKWIRAQ